MFLLLVWMVRIEIVESIREEGGVQVWMKEQGAERLWPRFWKAENRRELLRSPGKRRIRHCPVLFRAVWMWTASAVKWFVTR